MSDPQNKIVQEVPDELKEALKGRYQEHLEKRRAEAPASHFPWHDQQKWVLEAPGKIENPVRWVQINGGNRSGKSKLAMGLLSQILRRESPLNGQFMTTDPITGEIRPMKPHEPLRVWIVPPTGEKFREDWVNPADGLGIRHWLGDRFVGVRRAPDYVFKSAPPGAEVFDDEGNLDDTKCDRIIGKSQDQAIETFESSEVHVAIFDEEPQNKEIVTSTEMRLATSNGVMIFAMTPLHGLSWSYDRWWKPNVKQGRAEKKGDRRYMRVPDDEEMGAWVGVQMGMADNPRAETYAREVLDDPERSEAEKQARVYGEYGYVEGALVPSLAGIDLVSPSDEHKSYVVHELPEPHNIAQWYLVADPNKSYGAILSCIDTDGNLFFVAEHLKENWPNRLHAKKFEEIEKKWATGDVMRYADPGSAGAQSMIDLEDFGLYFDIVPKGAGSVSRSIKRLRGLAWVDPEHRHPIEGYMGAPRVYFYAPGLVSKRQDGNSLTVDSQLAEQMSSARQKEDAAPDTPDKDSKKLDLFDCARYTADIAMSSGPREDDYQREKIPEEDRLPTDKALRERRESQRFDPSSEPFTVPQYNFG